MRKWTLRLAVVLLALAIGTQPMAASGPFWIENPQRLRSASLTMAQEALVPLLAAGFGTLAYLHHTYPAFVDVLVAMPGIWAMVKIPQKRITPVNHRILKKVYPENKQNLDALWWFYTSSIRQYLRRQGTIRWTLSDGQEVKARIVYGSNFSRFIIYPEGMPSDVQSEDPVPLEDPPVGSIGQFMATINFIHTGELNAANEPLSFQGIVIHEIQPSADTVLKEQSDPEWRRWRQEVLRAIEEWADAHHLDIFALAPEGRDFVEEPVVSGSDPVADYGEFFKTYEVMDLPTRGMRLSAQPDFSSMPAHIVPWFARLSPATKTFINARLVEWHRDHKSGAGFKPIKNPRQETAEALHRILISIQKQAQEGGQFDAAQPLYKQALTELIRLKLSESEKFTSFYNDFSQALQERRMIDKERLQQGIAAVDTYLHHLRAQPPEAIELETSDSITHLRTGRASLDALMKILLDGTNIKTISELREKIPATLSDKYYLENVPHWHELLLILSRYDEKTGQKPKAAVEPKPRRSALPASLPSTVAPIKGISFLQKKLIRLMDHELAKMEKNVTLRGTFHILLARLHPILTAVPDEKLSYAYLRERYPMPLDPDWTFASQHANHAFLIAVLQDIRDTLRTTCISDDVLRPDAGHETGYIFTGGLLVATGSTLPSAWVVLHMSFLGRGLEVTAVLVALGALLVQVSREWRFWTGDSPASIPVVHPWLDRWGGGLIPALAGGEPPDHPYLFESWRPEPVTLAKDVNAQGGGATNKPVTLFYARDAFKDSLVKWVEIMKLEGYHAESAAMMADLGTIRWDRTSIGGLFHRIELHIPSPLLASPEFQKQFDEARDSILFEEVAMALNFEFLMPLLEQSPDVQMDDELEEAVADYLPGWIRAQVEASSPQGILPASILGTLKEVLQSRDALNSFLQEARQKLIEERIKRKARLKLKKMDGESETSDLDWDLMNQIAPVEVESHPEGAVAIGAQAFRKQTVKEVYDLAKRQAFTQTWSTSPKPRRRSAYSNSEERRWQLRTHQRGAIQTESRSFAIEKERVKISKKNYGIDIEIQDRPDKLALNGIHAGLWSDLSNQYHLYLTVRRPRESEGRLPERFEKLINPAHIPHMDWRLIGDQESQPQLVITLDAMTFDLLVERHWTQFEGQTKHFSWVIQRADQPPLQPWRTNDLLRSA